MLRDGVLDEVEGAEHHGSPLPSIGCAPPWAAGELSALGKAKKPEAIFSMAEREEAIRAATDIRRWTNGFNPAPWRVHRLAQALLESWDRIVLKSLHAAV